MKALLVGKDWFPNIAGGLNRYLYGEVCSLPDVDVDGVIMVSFIRGQQTAALDLRGMAKEGASLAARWRGANAIATDVLRNGVDVVNSHFALYTYPWIRRLPANVPLVVNFQGPYAAEMATEYTGPSRWPRRILAKHIEMAVYQRADRIITLSEAFRDIVHDQYRIPLDRIRVIPGGIMLQPYLNAPNRLTSRAQLGWPSDTTILLSIRRLARRMGLENLIDAMAIVVRTNPGALLFIGGTGEIEAELRAQIDRLHLQDNVRLLGFLPDAHLPLAYAAADVAIVPTVSLEGFGLVTAEALASGTPVLGTRVGGTTEILSGLNPDLLFDSPHPQDMADRILRSIANRHTLPSSAECRHYAAQYGWNNIVVKNREVFDQAVCERHKIARADNSRA